MNTEPTPAQTARLVREMTAIAGCAVEVQEHTRGLWCILLENELGALRIERKFKCDKVRADFSKPYGKWYVVARFN